jgi:hypothetical protein
LAAAVAVKDEFCYRLQLLIPTAEDMEDVGALLSQDSRPGDVILLDGDLGAGKTCFSRGFVRARTGQLEQRVTSPTYLLSNTYPTSDGIEYVAISLEWSGFGPRHDHSNVCFSTPF